MKGSWRLAVTAGLFVAAGGSWRLQAQTPLWTSLGLPDQVVLVIAIDPGRDTTLYAGTRAGVFKTTDGGATWVPRSTGLVPPVGELEIDIKAPSTLYCVANGSAFKTIDGGSSWFPVPIPGSVRSIKIDVSTPSTLYAATSQGIFRSRDAGASWISSSVGLTSLDVGGLVQARSSPSTLYASTSNPAALFRSSDGGDTWNVVFQEWTWGIQVLAVDPNLSSTVYVAGLSPFYPGHPGHWSPARSIDGGMTFWGLSTGGVAFNSPFAFAIDPIVTTTLYFAGAMNGQRSDIQRSVDRGESWTWIASDLPGQVASVNTVAVPGSTVLVGTNSGIFRATFAENCSPSASFLCLHSGRFLVELDFRAISCGRVDGVCLGYPFPISSGTGAFWIFDPANLDLVVKILDGRPINGKFWVFYGSLTNVEFKLTVTDTQTGAVKTYFNPQGQLSSVADTSAF